MAVLYIWVTQRKSGAAERMVRNNRWEAQQAESQPGCVKHLVTNPCPSQHVTAEGCETPPHCFPLALTRCGCVLLQSKWQPWPQSWAPRCALDLGFGCLWHQGFGQLAQVAPTITPAPFSVWSASRADPLHRVQCPWSWRDEGRRGVGRDQLSPCTNCSCFGFGEMWTQPLALFLRAVRIFLSTCSAPFSPSFYSCRDFPFAWVLPSCKEEARFGGETPFHWTSWDIWKNPKVSGTQKPFSMSETKPCWNPEVITPPLERAGETRALERGPKAQPPLTCTPAGLQRVLCKQTYFSPLETPGFV